MPRGKKVNIDEYLANIEEYLKMGCTINEACSLGEVPYRTVMDYYDKDERVRNKINSLKNFIYSVARQSVITNMADDGKLALDFLKNKKNKEFNTRENKEVSGGLDMNHKITLDDEEIIKRYNKQKKELD